MPSSVGCCHIQSSWMEERGSSPNTCKYFHFALCVIIFIHGRYFFEIGCQMVYQLEVPFDVSCLHPYHIPCFRRFWCMLKLILFLLYLGSPFDSVLHVKSAAAIIKMPNDENIRFHGSNFHGNEKRNKKGECILCLFALAYLHDTRPIWNTA